MSVRSSTDEFESMQKMNDFISLKSLNKNFYTKSIKLFIRRTIIKPNTGQA